MTAKTFSKIKRHKILFGLIFVLVLWGGYFSWQKFKSNENLTRYVTAAAEKGTLVVSVSGSGQVAALNQITVKPEVSGKVISIKAVSGGKVKSGDLLFSIDATDYQQAVVEAETALETAQLDLAELVAPADELTLLQTQNAVTKAQQTKNNAEKAITTGYEDAFNTITDVFFDLPTIVTASRDVLYSYTIAQSEAGINDSDWNVAVYQNSFSFAGRESVLPFILAAEQDYATARTYYDENLSDYKKTGYNASHDVISNLLDETATATKAVAQAIKSEINLLDFVNDYFTNHNIRIYSQITSYRSTLKSYYSQTNGFAQSLSSAQKTLQNNQQSLVDAEISLKEKQLALSDLLAGADELAIRAKKNTVKQKEQALATAQENLNNCFVYASLSGVIAEVNIKKGDAVSAGTSAITLISQQSIGEISLNETDIADVKIGQKATVVFDALEDLTVTGKVIEVDTLGTVNQGVVEYGANISLDTEDEKVKPGMTLSADIIIDVRQDVILVATSALKKQGDLYYVQIVENSDNATVSVSDALQPSDLKLQEVQIGSANDTMTEIVSGLREGDIIVTTTQKTTSFSGNTSSVRMQTGPAGGEIQMMQIMR